MKAKLISLITAGFIAVFAGIGVATLQPTAAYAALDCNLAANKNVPSCAVQGGVNATGASDPANNTCGNGTEECTLGRRITQVTNILLFIIGTIAVIMVILGGIRYTLSNGDSSQISSAKNTVLYAVIGLIVALLAFAIVNFVVTQFVK